jgi:hypothetical protein
MLNVPEEMWDTWTAGRFVGKTRPVTRAVVAKRLLKKDGDSPWRSLMFLQDPESMEIPNIKTVEIDRRLGSDAATMSMMIANVEPPTAQDNLDETHGGSGPTKRELKDLGKPGVYSFRRGVATADGQTNPWGHDVNAWVDMLIPNRVIYTFQGYGTNGAGLPQLDTNLVLTGIWLIDKVDYRSNATIHIQCRDAGKLLIEQRLYPPIIPIDNYPLEFCADHIQKDTVTRTETTTTGVPEKLGPNVARYITSGWPSSNAPWVSGNDGAMYGHRARDAFDGNESTYWLSMGNNGPNELWSFEWIGANCRGEPVNQIRFKQKWGGYRVYIGVKENGKWRGSSVVPYGYWTSPAAPNGSNIRYIKTFTTARNNNWITVDLDRVYNADEIRVVFTNLAYSGLGRNPYRAAVYELRAHHFQPSTVKTVTTEFTDEIETFVPGNANDYVDIVKLFLAWSGWFWPQDSVADPLLEDWYPGSNGRVWGDFFYSGAFPVDPPCIPPSYWDNKSVMDGINQIKEILGYVFYMDPGGAAIFRPPNIWKTGNFIQGVGYVGQDSLREVSEENVLIDYGVTIDDENLRSEIIAVSADDPSVYGVFRPGFASGETIPSAVGADEATSDLALLGGQQRPMLVPDYPFGTADDPTAQASVEKFAYLTSLWIHWSYRKSKFRIPGMPAFGPDDQVRIFERTTSETYVHYIQGVRSAMDLDAGTWIMDIDTHWLGNGPDSEWVVSTKDMHPALFAYLRSIGQIPDEVEDDQNLWPDDWFDYELPDIKVDPIIVEDEYGNLFPLPPDLQWPGNIDFESDDDYPDYVEPPTSGGGGSSGGTGGTSGGTVLNCSNTAMWKYWAPSGPYNQYPSQGGGCNTSMFVYYTWMNSSSHAAQTESIVLRIDKRGIPGWRALRYWIAHYNFRVKKSQTGSYSCRAIKNGTGVNKWSNHSWGTAADVNYTDYPIGRRIYSGDPLYNIGVRAESSIRLMSTGGPVFVWGNKWSNPDPMHFQICAPAAEVVKGVRATSGGGGNGGTFVV